jgi:chorismate mutase/prephenate dehydrogenase
MGESERQDHLERLRRRIRNLDAALLSLVAERMELAREVGRAKRDLRIPLRDFEVEKRVLERAAGSAGDLGLAPELARAVMRHLIEEACRLQEIEHFSAYSGEAETILVVGGAGQMGRWLARFLESQGHRVRIFDLPGVAAGGDFDRAATLAEGLDGASMVFVAVPLDGVAKALDAIAASGYRGMVCDVASLKEHLRPAIERARRAGIAVTSIHPMFGPTARVLSDKVICVCDCGSAEATERVTALFRDTAATLVPMSLERHDEIAAYVLGLSHFVNLLFARVLSESGLSFDELNGVGSTTFRRQFATTASVALENPSLYYSIQRANRFSERVYREVERAASDWIGWVERGEPAPFAGGMESVRRWIGEETGEES